MFDELGRKLVLAMSAMAAPLVLGDSPWSPDGHSLVAGCQSSEGGLYLFTLDGNAPRRLGSEVAVYASWSPDGKWIAYSTGETNPVFRRVRAEEPDAPLDLGLPILGATWSPDGAWLAAWSSANTLVLVRADGSSWKDIGPGLLPVWSPEGGRLACTVVDGKERFVELVDRDGAQRTRLTHGAAPSWSPDGHTLVFMDWQDGVEEGERTAQVFCIGADGSERVPLCDGMWPRWSPDGQRILVARMSFEDPFPCELVTVRPDGSDEHLLAKDGLCGRWSPDGSRVAFLRGAFFYELFVVNADGSGERSLGMVLPPKVEHALRGTTAEAEAPQLEGGTEPALGR